MVLTPMLSPSARLIGDLTLACLAPERFMIFGSGVAEAFHMRWFESRCPERGVTVRPLAAHLGGFAIAGPRARELLARLTTEDVSAEAFRFFAVRHMAVAMAPALVARVSFTGELGYEIYLEASYQAAVYDALLAPAGTWAFAISAAAPACAAAREEFWRVAARVHAGLYPVSVGPRPLHRLRQKGDFVGREAARETSATRPSEP